MSSQTLIGTTIALPALDASQIVDACVAQAQRLSRAAAYRALEWGLINALQRNWLMSKKINDDVTDYIEKRSVTKTTKFQVAVLYSGRLS